MTRKWQRWSYRIVHPWSSITIFLVTRWQPFPPYRRRTKFWSLTINYSQFRSWRNMAILKERYHLNQFHFASTILLIRRGERRFCACSTNDRRKRNLTRSRFHPRWPTELEAQPLPMHRQPGMSQVKAIWWCNGELWHRARESHYFTEHVLLGNRVCGLQSKLFSAHHGFLAVTVITAVAAREAKRVWTSSSSTISLKYHFLSSLYELLSIRTILVYFAKCRLNTRL